MQKTIQQFLLVIFALLQCMSPLAHAHVDGNNVAQSVHSHELNLHTQNGDIENDEGAVITMPQAAPISDSSIVVHPAIVAQLILPTINKSTTTMVKIPLRRAIIFSCFTFAWSQAPPRASVPA